MQNKLKNLIYFTLNFHSQLDCELKNQSPEYIMEKWNKYIGFEIQDNSKINGSQIIGKFYLDRWGQSQYISYDEFSTIYNYLEPISNYDLSELRLEMIVDYFRKFVGDLEMINADIYNNLHPLKLEAVNKWLEIPQNKRYLRLMTLGI